MLVLVPAFNVVGFSVFGLAPILAVLVVFDVLRRAGEFAIAKPTRETLFTVVSKEEKYQAKNVIDTVVHRGGDMASSWFSNALQSAGLPSAKRRSLPFRLLSCGLRMASTWAVTTGGFERVIPATITALPCHKLSESSCHFSYGRGGFTQGLPWSSSCRMRGSLFRKHAYTIENPRPRAISTSAHFTCCGLAGL